MSVYDELEFAPVLITDLFRIRGGEGAAKSDTGPVPYIAASFQRNGIVGFVDQAKYPGGWLSLVKDGDGGAGTCFYQPAPFWPSNHVFGLEPLDEQATEPALIVMASLITHQCFPKYNRGYAANTARLSRQRVMVPVVTDSDGEQVVDWEGMARLGEELFAEIVTLTHSARQTDAGDDDSLPDLRFEPMLITDVFETMKAAGKWFDLSKAKQQGAPVAPYVARSGGSNGIGAFLPHQGTGAPNSGNAITVGVSTSTVFYQPVPFYTSKEIQVLRHPLLDEFNGQMLVASLREQMHKFAWGNGASLDRLKATRIMVPVTMSADGDQVVDWDGMSRYGRALRIRAERHAFAESVMT